MLRAATSVALSEQELTAFEQALLPPSVSDPKGSPDRSSTELPESQREVLPESAQAAANRVEDNDGSGPGARFHDGGCRSGWPRVPGHCRMPRCERIRSLVAAKEWFGGSAMSDDQVAVLPANPPETLWCGHIEVSHVGLQVRLVFGCA